MIFKSIILLASIFFCVSTAYPGTPDLYLVYVRGKVVNAETDEPVAYAHVINPRSHGGTTTNADGIFNLQMLTEDTLIIKAVGFVDESFFISEFPPKNLYEIKMKPVRYLLKEVTVSDKDQMRQRLGLPEPKRLDVPVELRGDAYNEKPPWYAALLSPLSFVQYHTSTSEKKKRDTREIMKSDEQWQVFSRYHNLEAIERLTGLTGDKADHFMLYCNMHNMLPHTAGKMEVDFQIMDLFFKYQKEMQSKTED
jgi:hypothetical protein